MIEPSNDSFAFAEKVREVFRFLREQGFVETVALPSMVELVKNGVTVDIYCGRRSSEIGAGISFLGSRYALSEIVRVVAPGSGESDAQYRRNYSRVDDERAGTIELSAEAVRCISAER